MFSHIAMCMEGEWGGGHPAVCIYEPTSCTEKPEFSVQMAELNECSFQPNIPWRFFSETKFSFLME